MTTTTGAPAALAVAARRPTWVGAAALDGLLLGAFMVSAATFGTWLERPGSPWRNALPSADVRRVLMGVCMGLTAIALIYSPWGKRSGAHFNPATTLTFLRLGRVTPAAAAGYVVAQFAGGALGLWLASLWLGDGLAVPEVHWVATLPGPWGPVPAFGTEVLMAFAMMTVVLRMGQSRRWNRWTGVAAGVLVAVYIAVAAPVSGMSLNPARTVASALFAQDWRALWVYLIAPVVGMGLAADVFVRREGERAVRCAKLHHQNGAACTFRCRWGAD